MFISIDLEGVGLAFWEFNSVGGVAGDFRNAYAVDWVPEVASHGQSKFVFLAFAQYEGCGLRYASFKSGHYHQSGTFFNLGITGFHRDFVQGCI